MIMGIWRASLRAGVAGVLASCLLASPVRADEPGTFAKLADAILVRPLLLVPTAVATTLGIALFPYDVLAGLDGRTTYYFVEVPLAYFRERPLGDFSTPQIYPGPPSRR